MMNSIHIQTLAALVAALRPEWGEQGIRASLLKVQARDPFDVAIAAIKACRESSNRTPAVIAHMGPHWVEAKPVKHDTHGERLAIEKARMAAIRACGLCDDDGYRAMRLCTHREPGRRPAGDES